MRKDDKTINRGGEDLFGKIQNSRVKVTFLLTKLIVQKSFVVIFHYLIGTHSKCKSWKTPSRQPKRYGARSGSKRRQRKSKRWLWRALSQRSSHSLHGTRMKSRLWRRSTRPSCCRQMRGPRSGTSRLQKSCERTMSVKRRRAFRGSARCASRGILCFRLVNSHMACFLNC